MGVSESLLCFREFLISRKRLLLLLSIAVLLVTFPVIISVVTTSSSPLPCPDLSSCTSSSSSSLSPSFSAFSPSSRRSSHTNNVTLPRASWKRYMGLDFWNSNGIDFTKSLRAMFFETCSEVVVESYLFSSLKKKLTLDTSPIFNSSLYQTVLPEKKLIEIAESIRKAEAAAKDLLQMGKSSQILPPEVGEEGSRVSESKAIELTKSLLRIHFSKRYLSAQLTNSRLREPYDLLYSTYYQVLSAFYGVTTIELSGEKATTLKVGSEEQGNVPRTLDLNFWRDIKKNDQMLVDEYFILDIGEAVTPGWFDPEEVTGFTFWNRTKPLVRPLTNPDRKKKGDTITWYPLDLSFQKVYWPPSSTSPSVVVLVIEGKGKDDKANYGVTEVEGRYYYQEPEWDDVLYPALDYPYPEVTLRPVRLLGFILPCCGQKKCKVSSDLIDFYARTSDLQSPRGLPSGLLENLKSVPATFVQPWSKSREV